MNTQLHLCEWSEFDAHLKELQSKLQNGGTGLEPFIVLTIFDSLKIQKRRLKFISMVNLAIQDSEQTSKLSIPLQLSKLLLLILQQILGPIHFHS
ncbi:MAG TPA: hypothetical protein DCW35_01545 [Polynucleobacter sp.]|nr:hypothetical protein [Polynucleobacter sp.]